MKSGNQNRRLWKANCVQAALSVSLAKPASFTVNPFFPFQSKLSAQRRPFFEALTPASRTWEDHLWAEICEICIIYEEGASTELASLSPGSFWKVESTPWRKAFKMFRDIKVNTPKELGRRMSWVL